MNSSAYHQFAASGCISGDELIAFVLQDDNAARRKIGSVNIAHQIVGCDLIILIPLIQEVDDRIDQFPQVMRRDIGRHSDRNSAGPVEQQIGQGGRQDNRFVQGIIKIAGEIDRVFIDIIQQFHRVRG